MADPYAIIAGYPNAGQAFTDAFNKGQQQNALSAFAMNPNDPRAQAGAARYDPAAVAQVRQQQQQLSQQQLQQWHEYAGQLAKWADDPQKWDEAVDYMVSQGHPEAAQLKGRFSPALRQSFMALGGVKDEAAQPHFVPFQQGGGVVQVNADGTTHMVVAPNDGSQPAGAQVAQGPPPAAVARLRANPQEAAQFDEIFGPGAAQKVLGGATASTPSQGFP